MSAELEICCYSVDDALIAEANGADRIELCAGRQVGGTTPLRAQLERARAELTIPVFPMVRPRGGDFCFTPAEFDRMADDARIVAGLGFPGLVLGILNADRTVDVQRCRALISLARELNPDLQITFHRAFDDADDLHRAFDAVSTLAVQRLLTSGGAQTAPEAVDVIASLIAREHEGGVRVMPGSGVRPATVQAFLDLGASNVHSSATISAVTGVDAATVAELAAAAHA